MRLKLTVLISFFLIVISCVDKKASNLKKMEKIVHTYLMESAFKENIKLELIDLKILDYDTTNENYLDTLKLFQANERFEYFDNQKEKLIEKTKLESQLLRLYSFFNDKTLNDVSNENLQSSINELKRYVDSMKKYQELDSILRHKISNRIGPKEIYRAKFYIKSTVTKDNISENISDTVYYFFDKKLNFIPTTNIN